MIIQWSHHSAAHWARGITLNPLRQRGIWIVNANAIVWYLIHKYCMQQTTLKNVIPKNGRSATGKMQ